MYYVGIVALFFFITSTYLLTVVLLPMFYNRIYPIKRKNYPFK